MRKTLLLAALGGTLGLVGCDRASESQPGDVVQPQADEESTRAPPRERTPRPAPDSVAAPLPAEHATAAVEQPKEPLRFDMVKKGEGQTAEAFDKWMSEQGVRVAEGAAPGSSTGAQADAAVKAADAGATVQAKPGQTRP